MDPVVRLAWTRGTGVLHDGPLEVIMETTEQHTNLANLLKGTAREHHRAFEATDGRHADWPIWYAERLAGPLNAELGTDLSASELVHFLIAAERVHRAEAPEEAWPEFYAAYLIDRYLPEVAGARAS